MDEALEGEVRGAAFLRLLRSGSAASVGDLATDVGRPVAEVALAVAELSRRGRVRLNDVGDIVGSAGLSVGPDRHRMDVGGRTFWTWCAYDAVGILGALRADGVARSVSPLTGAPLEVRFRNGRPLPSEVVLFRPDERSMACCDNVYEEWCPNSNFFEDGDSARTWSSRRELVGRVLGLAEAAALGAKAWMPLTRGLTAGGEG